MGQRKNLIIDQDRNIKLTILDKAKVNKPMRTSLGLN